MMYPDVSLETWIRRYNLRILDYNCPKCGKQFRTTVPIITSNSAGLETPTHNCGVNYKKVILTPRTEQSKEDWYSIVDSLVGIQ